MRLTLLSFTFAFLSLTACSSDAIIKHVDAQTFHKLIKENDGIILDVRTPREIINGCIEGASTANIADRSGFISKIRLMQKDKPIFVYCYSGSRSVAAARILSQHGFQQIYNLSGGILAWHRSGYGLSRNKTNPVDNTPSYSLASFKEVLKKTDQPVVVDFHATWCAPCKKMAPIFEKLSAQYKSKAHFQKIDISKNAEIAKAYQIQSVPTFAIFKNGKVVWKHNGTMTSEELSKAIARFL